MEHPKICDPIRLTSTSIVNSVPVPNPFLKHNTLVACMAVIPFQRKFFSQFSSITGITRSEHGLENYNSTCVATSGVKTGNFSSRFCSLAILKIFQASCRCASSCFFRKVNHSARAHLRPSRTPATPCRFSRPAENATTLPHSGFSLAWQLNRITRLTFHLSVCHAD